MTYFSGEQIQQLQAIVEAAAETSEEAASLLEGFNEIPYLNVLETDVEAVAEEYSVSLTEDQIKRVIEKIQSMTSTNLILYAIDDTLKEGS